MITIITDRKSVNNCPETVHLCSIDEHIDQYNCKY